MNHSDISKKRQKEIDAFLATPVAKGDRVLVKGNIVESVHGKDLYCTIVEVKTSDTFIVQVDSRDYDSKYVISTNNIVERSTFHIGVDPFKKERDKVQMVQFSLESIIHVLDLLDEKEQNSNSEFIAKELNWDPFVYSETGEKQRYQRPLIWTLPQKKALISSIYNKVDCGKIIVRDRTYEQLRQMHLNGETELAYHDIVDGKQRLNAVKEFMLGQFKDVHGNHYGDLSINAQRQFKGHQLFSYGKMIESATDDDVLEQFLKLNFSGIPQSPKHMKFVERLYRERTA